MPISVQKLNSSPGEPSPTHWLSAHAPWLVAVLATLFLAVYTLPRPDGAASQTWIKERDRALNDLRDAVNRRYGFLNGGPRINQGPCAAFAFTFLEEWNRRFESSASAWAIAAPDRPEVFHVLIRLPDGTFFDGGRGVLPARLFRRLLGADRLIEVEEFDQAFIEEHFGHRDRKYPRCPTFDLPATRNLISQHLDRLLSGISNRQFSHLLSQRFPLDSAHAKRLERTQGTLGSQDGGQRNHRSAHG